MKDDTKHEDAMRRFGYFGCEIDIQVCLSDEFDILQIVGEGWFGKILLAEHRHTDTEMVLKALPKQYTALRDFYREFHYGLHLAAHRNIITTYDVAFETAGFYVFAQEYAPLGDLTSNVSETGIGETHSKRVARQLASALEHMHTRDLVHRDVKLDNVLVLRSDFSRVKLCDFGETRRVSTLVRRRNEWLPYTPPEVLLTNTDETYNTPRPHSSDLIIFLIPLSSSSSSSLCPHHLPHPPVFPCPSTRQLRISSRPHPTLSLLHYSPGPLSLDRSFHTPLSHRISVLRYHVTCLVLVFFCALPPSEDGDWFRDVPRHFPETDIQTAGARKKRAPPLTSRARKQWHSALAPAFEFEASPVGADGRCFGDVSVNTLVLRITIEDPLGVLLLLRGMDGLYIRGGVCSRRADTSHDVWQFAIVVFVCLTGCLPWQKAGPDDPRYVRYMQWQASNNVIMMPVRRPKLFKQLSSRAQRLFRKYLEPRPEKRPKGLADLQRFLDDRWLGGRVSAERGGAEDDELCPSMYSYHSSAEEKDKLLFTLTQYGIETTVDRSAKKDRIREWIQSSVIEEEGEEEAEDEDVEEEREEREENGTFSPRLPPRAQPLSRHASGNDPDPDGRPLPRRRRRQKLFPFLTLSILVMKRSYRSILLKVLESESRNFSRGCLRKDPGILAFSLQLEVESLNYATRMTQMIAKEWDQLDLFSCVCVFLYFRYNFVPQQDRGQCVKGN
ncbi:Serine/threonine-protein kinase meng-po [Gryllus bimaculatus]|nr:Serine/threonine-protein kinase meng-po [Gryllus bimaculatus]